MEKHAAANPGLIKPDLRLAKQLINQTYFDTDTSSPFVKMLPSPETIRDNVILALPKLVEGMLVTSEFVDRGGNPDSYFEEYVAEVVAILSVEQQQRLESTDGQKVVLKYELTFEAERRYFSWNFLTDGRLTPRGEWQWEHDDGHFFRVSVRRNRR